MFTVTGKPWGVRNINQIGQNGAKNDIKAENEST